MFLCFFLICMSFSMFLMFYRIFVQFGILGWICNAIGILNPFVDCQIHRFFYFLLASGRTLIFNTRMCVLTCLLIFASICLQILVS